MLRFEHVGTVLNPGRQRSDWLFSFGLRRKQVLDDSMTAC